MVFLVAFSAIHKTGTFVSSMVMNTSIPKPESVAARHLEFWAETISSQYDELGLLTIRILSFQPIAHTD